VQLLTRFLQSAFGVVARGIPRICELAGLDSGKQPMTLPLIRR